MIQVEWALAGALLLRAFVAVTLVLADADTTESVGTAFVWCLCSVCFVSMFRVARLVKRSVCVVQFFFFQ